MSIHLATEGSSKPWDSRKQLRSPCYTTQWAVKPSKCSLPNCNARLGSLHRLVLKN
ncbi:DUF4113 domain-containing protein [Legionella rowbothamii]|uniref:DUF4113 domain-containing protein n=1 Tax=Legionella rowbothamii TaxID=96229 RepID=UPI001054F065